MIPNVAELAIMGAFVVIPKAERDIKKQDVVWWAGRFRTVISWKVDQQKQHRLYHLAAAETGYSKAFTIPLKMPLLVLVRPV